MALIDNNRHEINDSEQAEEINSVGVERRKEKEKMEGSVGRSGSGEWEGKMKNKKEVLLEGYVDRTKSLTDEDLDELKGCLDLGFGFSYDEIPQLCNTLPALELCYSLMSSSSFANWKISSPGDHPDDVKARLKYWAQAVACTVKLCS